MAILTRFPPINGGWLFPQVEIKCEIKDPVCRKVAEAEEREWRPMRDMELEFEVGTYIWQASGGDQRVVVQSVLGVGPDGRLYVQVEGSRVGVPFDECRKESYVSRKPQPKRLF